MIQQITDYKDEIREYLKQNNIFFDVKDCDGDLFILGILLNNLNEGKPLDKSVMVVSGKTPQFDTADYIISINDSEVIADERLKHNKAIETFGGKYLNSAPTFMSGEINDCKVTAVSFDNNLNQWCIQFLTSISTSLCKGLFARETIEKNVGYLTEISQRNYTQCFDKIFETSYMDFEKLKAEKIRRDIKVCSRYLSESRKKAHEESIRNLRNDANDLISRYRETIKELNEKLALSVNEDGSDEYVDALSTYLMSNKVIKIDQIVDNSILYNVVGKLCVFDEEMYNPMTNNFKGSLYCRPYCQGNEKYVKKALDAIFVEKKYVINTIASFRLFMDIVPRLEVNNAHCNYKTEYPNRMPSPHVMLVKCEGGFGQIMAEALANVDYISAIQTAISWSQNINWTDSFVTGRMMDYLHEHKCIEDLETGEFMTLPELIEKIKESGENDN